MSIVFELPYPEACLAQNARGMWAVHAPRKKKARVVAKRLTKAALAASNAKISKSKRLRVDLVFHPPLLKRRRDLQNLIGASKYAVDGIADAVGIDDSEFKLSFDWGAPVEGGATVVTLS